MRGCIYAGIVFAAALIAYALYAIAALFGGGWGH